MSKKNLSLIRLFQSEDGKTKFQVRIEDETVWLSQKLIADLYQVSVKTINEHQINIYDENELMPEATSGNLAVGYRVRSIGKSYFKELRAN